MEKDPDEVQSFAEILEIRAAYVACEGEAKSRKFTVTVHCDIPSVCVRSHRKPRHTANLCDYIN